MRETSKIVPELPTLADLDWSALECRLDDEGFAVTAPLLSPGQCAGVVDMVDDDARFRNTVIMARHAYGEGSYRYFADPLPPLVQRLRESLYPPLTAIANRWAQRLGERCFPEDLDGLLGECAALGQHKPTPLVLRYGPGATTACTRTSTATSPSRSSCSSCSVGLTRTSPAGRACSSSSDRANSRDRWWPARAKARR